MNQREKLIELIGDSLCCPKETDCTDCEYKKYELCTEAMVADYLLANGVVVLPCRCGECEHHDDCICVVCEDGETVVCSLQHGHVDKNGYCNYAERR